MGITEREVWEKTCVKCNMPTDFRSVDGGLTSMFKCSRCGHMWTIMPGERKEGNAGNVLRRELKGQ